MSVEVSLRIELKVNCPVCQHRFDLLSDTDLNDDGWLLDQVMPDGDRRDTIEIDRSRGLSERPLSTYLLALNLLS